MDRPPPRCHRHRHRPRHGLRPAALTALVVAVVAGGCGETSSHTRAVGITQIPLAAGARVAEHVRSCDRGADAYCSEQLVVTGPGFPDSFSLLVAERAQLKRRGWSSSQGMTGKEVADESPGHELRLTYATAYNDLLALDSGWIRRTGPIGHALARVLFDRTPAISLLLQRGSS